jgi:adenylosuccinate synthase
MKVQAVIGCGFGDEGKGKVVSYLCSQSSNPLIIRFCGGHQAGHHVMINDKLDHVFSNFGSGTLQGFDTYWSKYCTVDPIGILNELDVLKIKGISPVLYIDEQCPVTTPYEKMYNLLLDDFTKHGSCGVGVGQTIKRQEDHYSILMSDLCYPNVLKIKMGILRNYYRDLFQVILSFKKYFVFCDSFMPNESEINQFLDSCENLLSLKEIKLSRGSFGKKVYDRFIFEGSQGLLLDQNIGFFPHVTRANTGTKNILEMGFTPEIILVTRAYQTRHGNGPMTNEGLPHNISPNPYENNSDSTPQGKFRISLLDLDLLRYAINGDKFISSSLFSLVITCLDLVEKDYEFSMNGGVYALKDEYHFVDRIKREISAYDLFVSKTPFPIMEGKRA